MEKTNSVQTASVGVFQSSLWQAGRAAGRMVGVGDKATTVSGWVWDLVLSCHIPLLTVSHCPQDLVRISRKAP